jgi:hypothetical protein
MNCPKRPRDRGVSTVVDVTLFVLLVSASVLSLSTAGTTVLEDPTAVGREEAAVETLATTTATVRYDLGTETRTGETVHRVRHGTLAELLGEAALAAVTVDGTRLSPYGDGFVGTVGEAVRPVLDGRMQVVATWTPYPGSSLRGRVTVGPSPPPDATVHAATLAVDSGVPAAREPALAAADTGYRGVADVVARRTVHGLFPPRRTRVALDGGAVDANVTRAAFARTASAYGSDTRLETGVTPATYDLTVAVSNRTRAELRDRFDTPQAAASAVRTDRVTVVVRTWS